MEISKNKVIVLILALTLFSCSMTKTVVTTDNMTSTTVTTAVDEEDTNTFLKALSGTWELVKEIVIFWEEDDD